MVEQWWRPVWHTVRVGGEEITLRISEEYSSENPGIPVRVVIGGPNGLKTEGDFATAWREMLELLGIEPPAPTIESPEQVKTQQNEESGAQMHRVPHAHEALALPKAAVSKPEVLPPLSKAAKTGAQAPEVIESYEVATGEEEVEEDMKAADLDEDVEPEHSPGEHDQDAQRARVQ